jgi:hypothetical protein
VIDSADTPDGPTPVDPTQVPNSTTPNSPNHADPMLHSVMKMASAKLDEEGKSITLEAQDKLLDLNAQYLDALIAIAISISNRSGGKDNSVSAQHISEADAVLRVPANTTLTKFLNAAGAVTAGAGLSQFGTAVVEFPASHIAYLVTSGLFVLSLLFFALAWLWSPGMRIKARK